MAPNFSRCVTIFGSSCSEARPSTTTFSPSPLMGCLVALEVVGEPAADTELPEPGRQADGPWCTAPDTRITAAVAVRDDAGQHSWSKLPASSRQAISRNGVYQE